MHRVDHLRERIRAKQEARAAADADATIAEPISATGRLALDSHIEEVFQELTAEDPPQPQAQSVKSLKAAWLDRLKPLEVNKKMLALSLAVAAVASFLSMNYFNSIVSPLKDQSRLLKVLVVTQDIPARTLITQEMLSIKEVPNAYIPAGAIPFEPNLKILGKVSLTSLYKGEILNSNRIALPSETTGLAMKIPAGHRAITIRSENAHLMKPSDHVDVIASVADLNPIRRGKVISIPVLQRAQILAVGNQFSAEGKPDASAYQGITVAVPEERVNIMSILEEKGNFKVALRSPADLSVLPEKYTVQEVEDALLGKFERTRKSADDTLLDQKPSVKPIADIEPEELKEEPLVDLSEPAPVQRYAPAYRRNASRAARPAVRNYSTATNRYQPRPAMHRAARTQIVQPASRPQYVAPAAPRNVAPIRPRTVNVINGGVLTQVNGGSGQ